MSKKRNKKYTPRRPIPYVGNGSSELAIAMSSTEFMTESEREKTELSWRLHHANLLRNGDASSRHALLWAASNAVALSVVYADKGLNLIANSARSELDRFVVGQALKSTLTMVGIMSRIMALKPMPVLVLCANMTNKHIAELCIKQIKSVALSADDFVSIAKGAPVKLIASITGLEPKQITDNFLFVASILHKLNGDMSVPDPIKLGDVRGHKVVYLKAIGQARLVLNHG